MTTLKLIELNKNIKFIKEDAKSWTIDFSAEYDLRFFLNKIDRAKNITNLLDVSKDVYSYFSSSYKSERNKKRLYEYLIEKFEI